jgi:midasin
MSALKGDFRSGKKLNMKRIIPYIASEYRKDKIWLRKTEPDEKNYKIMIAVDNSLSMKEKSVGKLALFSLAILS